MNLKLVLIGVAVLVLAGIGVILLSSSPAQAPGAPTITTGPTEPPPGDNFQGPTTATPDDNTAQPSIKVLSPNGGEIISPEQNLKVTWNYLVPKAHGGPYCVTINVNRTDANLVQERIWGYPEFNPYLGTERAEKGGVNIPISNLPPDNDYKIELSLSPCEKRAEAIDQSDSSFTIGAPQDKITQVLYSCTEIKNAICILPYIFQPSTINIQLGGTVLFSNRSGIQTWPASDPHPTHTGLPSFDAKKPIPPSGEYSYTFTQKGTWKYHDHLNPSAKGTIIVE